MITLKIILFLNLHDSSVKSTKIRFVLLEGEFIIF